MKKHNIYKLLEDKNIPKNKYVLGTEIYEIILKNGIVITPNIYAKRFKFNEKSLCIKYGHCSGYGSIIMDPQLHYGGSSVFFTKIKKPVIYENLSFPKPGDVFVISKNGKILFKSFITSSTVGLNGTSISISSPCKILDYKNFTFSYYSIVPDDELNVKGEIDGVYLKFTPFNKKKYQYKINYSKILKIKTTDGINYD